jgi:GNAT superfamily N-acetyltransferase
MIPVKLYSSRDKAKILDHLLVLGDEDRRLRFGLIATNLYIEKYVDSSWSGNSVWFAIWSGKDIVAACHVVIDKDVAELGFSVIADHRNRGLAQSLFNRAIHHIRSHNITNVYMHCLTENQAMRHIAKKNDMTIVSYYGDSDARIEVEPPTAFTVLNDNYLDRIAMYDMMIRSQADVYQSVLENLTNVTQTIINRNN